MFNNEDSLRMKNFKSLRFNDETEVKIKKLMDHFPNRFYNPSHLIRCAVHNFYNKEMLNNPSPPGPPPLK